MHIYKWFQCHLHILLPDGKSVIRGSFTADLSPLLSLLFSLPLSLLLSLSSSLSLPQLATKNLTLELPTTFVCPTAAINPSTCTPNYLEREINSGLHTYVARQTDRQTQTGRQTERQTQAGRPTDRQTDGSLTLSRGLRSSKRQQCQISAERSGRHSCWETHVGNTIPANTTAITQEALIRTNSGLAGYMHMWSPSPSHCKISDDVRCWQKKTTHTVGDLHNT